MAIAIGSTGISNMYIGGTQISKAYMGDVQVYPNSSATKYNLIPVTESISDGECVIVDLTNNKIIAKTDGYEYGNLVNMTKNSDGTYEIPDDAEVFNCMWGSTSEIIIMWVGDKSISAYLKSSWAYYRLCNSTITDYTKERSIALGANSTIISGSYCLSTGTSDDYASFYTSDVIRTKLTLCKIVQA